MWGYKNAIRTLRNVLTFVHFGKVSGESLPGHTPVGGTGDWSGRIVSLRQ